MGLEIEIKARVLDEEVNSILNLLKTLKCSNYIGKIKKSDVYWSKSIEDKPILRTRVEEDEKTKNLYLTSKPNKTKINGTEINTENEFQVSLDQKEKVEEFISGLGLVICRLKSKEGYQFLIEENGIQLHAELLNVKFLGWFLEIEMTDETVSESEAENAILKVFDEVNLSRDRIEPTGYYKLLKACGHSLG